MISGLFYRIGISFIVLVCSTSVASAQERKGASEECGADRRCRIQRIKDINQTRRRNAFFNDRNARRSGRAQAEKERLKKTPRTNRPFTAEMRSSRVGFFGLAMGYQFADNFRGQLSWHLVDIVNYSSATIALYGSQFGLSLEYFLTTGAFAPFLSSGFYIYDGPAGTNYSSSSGSTGQQGSLHFAELGAGFDVQLDGGYRFRLMGAYKPLLYHQGIVGDTHDESVKNALKETFDVDMQIDVVVQLGYAF